jgi:hypothetical protein
MKMAQAAKTSKYTFEELINEDFLEEPSVDFPSHPG